jgi:hypothetical protein
MITEPAIRVIAAAVSLSAICAALRLRIEYFPVHNVDTAFWITKLTLRSSYYDMLLTWGLAIGCIISLVFTLRLKRVQNSIVSAYLVFSVLSVVFACINVPAVSYIGS